MIARASGFALLVSTVMLAGCAATGAAPAVTIDAPPVASVGVTTPHQRLFQLFKDSDEASLKLNPISGIYRGDMR